MASDKYLFPYRIEQKKRLKVLCTHFFVGSWWVYLTLALIFLFYRLSMDKKEKVYNDLHKKLERLQIEKHNILDEQEELILQIQSQDDPLWIEMILKKKLGLVSKGEQKFFFEQSEE
ncbi:MAG: hypothetical protein ACOVOR_00175 [Rhabdochlamydiaceae bacterium]